MQISPTLTRLGPKFNSGVPENRNHRTRRVLLEPHARRQGVKRVYGLSQCRLHTKALHHMGEETLTGLNQVQVTVKETT